MADGTGYWTSVRGSDAGGLRLSDALSATGFVRARCMVASCGLVIDFHPRHWLALDLGGLPMRHFETRMRCRCGARQVRFELSPERSGSTSGGGPYVFR